MKLSERLQESGVEINSLVWNEEFIIPGPRLHFNRGEQRCVIEICQNVRMQHTTQKSIKVRWRMFFGKLPFGTGEQILNEVTWPKHYGDGVMTHLDSGPHPDQDHGLSLDQEEELINQLMR